MKAHNLLNYGRSQWSQKKEGQGERVVFWLTMWEVDRSQTAWTIRISQASTFEQYLKRTNSLNNENGVPYNRVLSKSMFWRRASVLFCIFMVHPHIPVRRGASYRLKTSPLDHMKVALVLGICWSPKTRVFIISLSRDSGKMSEENTHNECKFLVDERPLGLKWPKYLH